MTVQSVLKLPSKPDKVTLELLSKARMFLEHAISHASTPSGLDGMIAIHELDNVIEYLLRIVAHHIDYESVSGKAFDSDLAGMAGELNRFLKDQHGFNLPYINEIKMIRQVRNLVQHGAIDPAADLPRFQVIVERFFNKVLKLVFDLSSEELESSALVRHSEVKKFLQKAEKNIKGQKFLDAIVACRDAFENALFVKSKNSRIKFDAAPALAEARQKNKFDYWLFTTLIQEVEAIRLGMNPIKYERFKEILNHIPFQYKADKTGGYSVMPRPWSRQDAVFCYGFVINCVLQWQYEELEPLYQRQKVVNEVSYSWVEKIEGITLGKVALTGYGYFFDPGDRLSLFYGSRSLKSKLGRLIPGNVYDYLFERYDNKKMAIRVKERVELVHIFSEIATNNPEHWEIILWFRSQPFTTFREEFKDGKKIKESFCINSASAKELSSIYGITEDIAKKIVAFRKAIGPITNINDLKKIKGISDGQIQTLAHKTILK